MASEWPLRPLSEISVNFDALRRPVKEQDRVAGPYPYYGASGIVDHVDGFLFAGEYVLVGEDGENLRTRATPIAFRATGKFWVNNHAHILQGNDDALTRYLEYAIQGTDIGPYLTGAVMPKLTQGNLKRVLIPCPPRRTQEQIVAVLGALDDRIDLLRQTNALLEAIAQALFKSWFVDFDPVRAKTEGREPEGMDATTAALLPTGFEEAKLGLIPKGWRSGTLRDLSALNASKWTTKQRPDWLSYIDLSGVSNNRIDPPTEYRFDDAPSRARHHLRDGDTIIGTVRPGNRAFAFISEPASTLTGSTGFAVLSPRSPDLFSFVYLAATRDEAIERLANLADGGAYPAVRPSIVAATSCVVPQLGILKAFSDITQPLLNRIARNESNARTLSEIRDTLLPRLISGKLRLPEAEAHTLKPVP
jgi:type I restriction enzyme, S subunit